ncbi:hypothetical protein AEAC466_04905 [Asticcacaulis sp. AC466]|nr:hypothetical protein AEAC466_04905 [Asticcacaulis sp. AC466]
MSSVKRFSAEENNYILNICMFSSALNYSSGLKLAAKLSK